MDESQCEAGRMDHASYIVDRMRVLREARGSRWRSWRERDKMRQRNSRLARKYGLKGRSERG